jgi:uncharacterized protein (TIRG00374 family)
MTSEERETHGRGRPAGWRRVLKIGLAVAIVVAIFAGVIPTIASYSAIWRTLSHLTGFELALIAAAATLNLVTYWLQSMAAMPGLSFGQAAVETQTTTTVANTVPGGGAIAVGLGYAMFRSWGFADADIGLFVLITGIWNTLIKFALPVIALGLLAAEGGASPQIVTASLIGLAALAVAVALLWLVLWKRELAAKIGAGLGRMVSFVRRLLHKDEVDGERAAVEFREKTIELLRRRWIPLTLTTILSHLSLYLVLLASLRVVGVSQSEVTWIEALGVFAFGRLVTALPVTPGGVGVIELSYIGGLVFAGGDRAAVAAAVLLFRAFTYVVQIPLGAITYPVWQHREAWKATARTSRNGSSPRRRKASSTRATRSAARSR